ncbi:hypothetical protein GUJ93_ZPchr0013g36517 [Zizania palustris]|uniref:Uncharacterized protein n=1 Tax=Zizania palustris TaxID=103762 RepID=A0A8J5X2G9_ZIZPA|nr:hypothetical protein GUJ93_ZPchr0013g36517 [Zizania palustris]
MGSVYTCSSHLKLFLWETTPLLVVAIHVGSNDAEPLSALQSQFVFVRDGIVGVCRHRVIVYGARRVTEDEEGGFGVYGVPWPQVAVGEVVGFSSSLEAVAVAVVSMAMESSSQVR